MTESFGGMKESIDQFVIEEGNVDLEGDAEQLQLPVQTTEHFKHSGKKTVISESAELLSPVEKSQKCETT